MLQLAIPSLEYYDERLNEFIVIDGALLNLEHSLKSIAEWESKWNRSFISNGPKKGAEIVDYVRCMTLNSDVNPKIYLGLTDNMIRIINAYIQLPMTATTFSKSKPVGSNRKTITAEQIYYKMFSYNIPLECENWHLNRLVTLLRVFDAQNAPKKNISKKEAAKSYRELNASRRQQLNTRG